MGLPLNEISHCGHNPVTWMLRITASSYVAHEPSTHLNGAQNNFVDNCAPERREKRKRKENGLVTYFLIGI